MPFNSNIKDEDLLRVSLAPGYGYAILPKDWPILNIEYAASAKYVYCGRSMNAAKYGVPPMVVYFSQASYWDIPARDTECARMDALFMKYSKACEDAFSHHQVTEKWISDDSGQRICLNREEWAESFFLFHEDFPVVGSMLPYCDSTSIRRFHHLGFIIRPDEYDYADENRVAEVSEENNWKGKYR